MREDRFEILSTFADGEPVDTRELAEVLTRPGAREALLDYSRLRVEIEDDDSRPGPAFYEKMNRVLESPTAKVRWWWSFVPMPVPALAALVLIVFGLAAWSLAPWWRAPSTDSPTPPEPTRVIHFENGVDWYAG